MSLLADYFATPDTWDTTVVLDRLIGAQNAWLADHNRRRQAGAAALTTLTALVLHGQTCTLAHVGDTRAWLCARGEQTQLTQDHAFDHPDISAAASPAPSALDDGVRGRLPAGRCTIGDCSC